MKGFLFLDGKELAGKLPLRAVLYGEGVFETFRWKGSPPVLLARHLKRMRRGAKLLDIPFPSETRIKRAIQKAVNISKIEDANVKLCLLSSGPLTFHENPTGSSLLVVVRKYKSLKSPMRAHVTSIKRNSSSPLSQVKSLNYLENVYARREAKRAGFDEAIFLNERGELTEGSSTNLFWVNRSTLFTPLPECGLLPGITRGLLIELAPELGLEVREGRFSLKDLNSSQTAFLTNSLLGIAAISDVDGMKIRFDQALFSKLRDALFEKLGWVCD